MQTYWTPPYFNMAFLLSSSGAPAAPPPPPAGGTPAVASNIAYQPLKVAA